MNEKIKKNITLNNSILTENNSGYFLNEEKIKTQIYDEFNLNATSSIYRKDEYKLKKNLDKLNQKFTFESNKYISIKAELEKTQDNLFYILFKQITYYIEEVEKLNFKIKEKDENLKFYKTKCEDVNKLINLVYKKRFI